MSSVNRISFYGGETAGTPAYLTKAKATNEPEIVTQPEALKLSFQANDTFERRKETDKGVSKTTVALGALAATALIIGGLGYAHKIDVLSKMKEGKAKELLSKIEPVAKTCHEWCSSAKVKGNECLEGVKKFFNSKNA